jgi:hypothetical protein
VGKFDGILFNPEFKQSTMYPSAAHLNSSGHTISNLVVKFTNHNQNITAGVVTSSDNKTTVSLDGMVTCCNLQREREGERERNCS